MENLTETQPVKITTFEAEAVKRIKCVELTPKPSGLTVIGGKNAQGKTSILDAIAFTLGGNKFKPSNIKNNTLGTEPYIKVTLSNGLIVERKGRASALKITSPDTDKAGQAILNEFIEELALNLPKFISATSKEKTKILLNIIGAEKDLLQLEDLEKEVYTDRAYHKKQLNEEVIILEEAPQHKDVPEELIELDPLLKEINQADTQRRKKEDNDHLIDNIEKDIQSKQQQISALEQQLKQQENDLENIKQFSKDIVIQDIDSIKKQLEEFEALNNKIKENILHKEKENTLKKSEEIVEAIEKNLKEIREKKQSLLSSANLPLPDLSINNGELIYKGQQWDCMSGVEQLIVATSIVKSLNPLCGFVLLDKLEQMDIETLQDFGAWAKEQGLQIIATRVSTGKECSVIIEDGTDKEIE